MLLATTPMRLSCHGGYCVTSCYNQSLAYVTVDVTIDVTTSIIVDVTINVRLFCVELSLDIHLTFV